MLHWLQVADLAIDPTYQRPVTGKGRRNVQRIAREFSWSCFSPVVVSPIEGGKYAIIDGQHRTTAAALLGLESVPCQVVIAAREEQAAAFKAINGITTPISRMALHAAAVTANEEEAIKIADVCNRAKVRLLRYPVPADKQEAGHTMAVGAIARCLRRYGEETLITALQCVTETINNKPGMLTARMITALCEVLDKEREWRDGGLALLEAFDAIDLSDLRTAPTIVAGAKKGGRAGQLAELIRTELDRLLPRSRRVAEGQEEAPKPSRRAAYADVVRLAANEDRVPRLGVADG
jgi:hypothetical protein